MKSNYDILGNHIRLIDTRNRESITDRVLGINIDKFFMPSVANVIGTDLSKYKLITKGKFACNPMHVGRDERLPVALYDEEEPAIVSPAYFMFEVIDNSILNEDYLMMWFRRPEFDRICWLHTDGSVRGGITWDDICRLELPIPPIEKQLEIVNSYKAITERIALKQKINDNLLASMEAILDKYYTDAFGDTKLSQISEFPIPDDWKIYQLSDLAECQSGYAFYKDGYNDDGIRIVDLGNINRNAEFIQAKTDKYILPERVSAQKYDKFRLYKNDLVMVMTDRKSTMELLGKTGRIYTKEPLLLNQRVYRIRTNSLTSYLYVYLNSERVHIFHKSRALGTAQKYVNNGDINIIPIVLPPKQILEKLLKLFDNSWTIMEHNLNEMNALSILQDQITLMLSSY
jgi:restriction endonuclease S subunit